ncbi:YdcF family protein [Nitratiruptor sp. YY09-18]|uniref:YdcF family protein n=1 Tax=Nitratiruptor sp. YY09-18 TaxID=2724901 RepID=UPI001916AB2A|nr:YdcF family protein [Nitratiruptor sp. YY09-18]BCD67491.1 hypothetical protein NitYY0918_C0384 [Nitratiruptor sp. YY09-18]
MCKKIFYILISMIIICIAGFFSFSDEILTEYAKFFTVNNATKKADLIFILGGNPKTRPAKAVELVKQGFSNKVVMTHIKDKALKYQNFFIKEEKLTEAILKSESIPFKIIPCIKKDGATSTFDEAYSLAEYVKNNNLKHVIIVTDAFHTKRALYAFKKIFRLEKLNTKVEVAAAYNGVYRENNWWKTEKGLRSYIIEPIKFLFYIFNSKNLNTINN